ncbi:MAG TPA: hypothetical protein VFB29_13170 [Pseudolabrys sp.]|nr:hypothetical protein [Pseudolabrys sp.]
MRKLLIATSFAVMVVSPAFAQSYSPGFGTGNVIDLPALERGGNLANGAYAYQADHTAVRGPSNVRIDSVSPNDPDAVYEAGQYIGRDPDPNVRLQLRRDWTHD